MLLFRNNCEVRGTQSLFLVLFAEQLRIFGTRRNSEFVDGLPGALRGPLSEPLFILGALFVALVMFFPGGIAGLRDAAVGRRLRSRVARLPGAGEGG